MKKESNEIKKQSFQLKTFSFISIIFIILLMIFIKLSYISINYLQKEEIKAKIQNIMKNLNYDKITFNKSQFSNNKIIDKFEITTNDDIFDIYIYNKKEIYNIVNKRNNKEIYSNKKQTFKNDDNEDVIILIDGLFGAYGKINVNDSSKIKYYLPKGKYKFRRLNSSNIFKEYKEESKVFIQKTLTDKNSQTFIQTVNNISFTNNLFIEMDIKEDEFLEISENAIFEVQKISK